MRFAAEEDQDCDEGGRKEETHVKSNSPHLTGGEQSNDYATHF